MRILFIVLMVVFGGSRVSAQDQKRPDTFFSKQGGGTWLEDKPQKQRARDTIQFEDESGEGDLDELEREITELESEIEQLESEERDSSEESEIVERDESLEQGPQILWLGAIVDANEKAHLEEVINTYSQVLQRFDFDAGPLYLVGKRADYSFDYVQSTMRNKGVALSSFTKSIPSRYQVTFSPSWILQTTEGQIIIEANSIQKFIGLGGRFKPPSGQMFYSKME